MALITQNKDNYAEIIRAQPCAIFTWLGDYISVAGSETFPGVRICFTISLCLHFIAVGTTVYAHNL
jgi:hypothetical protein